MRKNLIVCPKCKSVYNQALQFEASQDDPEDLELSANEAENFKYQDENDFFLDSQEDFIEVENLEELDSEFETEKARDAKS